MADLSVSYLGLDLKNPLVPSSSPLTKGLDRARHLEDAGAAALVMYSLYEEEIVAEEHHYDRFLEHQSLGHGEASSFLPEHPGHQSSLERYLEQLATLKRSLDIPVIASLNGSSEAGWVDFSQLIQEAGADALELSLYHVADNPAESAIDVEERYLEVLRHLRDHVTIPIAVKMFEGFSSPLNMVDKLMKEGATGIVIFSRLYQVDIDLETLAVKPRLQFSGSYEALSRIRWAAMIRSMFDVDLGLTGGFHETDDIIKGLLSGANIVQLGSTLLQHGPGRLAELIKGIGDWLDENDYESVKQMAGSLSANKSANPDAYSRHDYLTLLDSFKPPPGVRY
jgi:dihydroorotate dehydrogenase (fumarate)